MTSPLDRAGVRSWRRIEGAAEHTTTEPTQWVPLGMPGSPLTQSGPDLAAPWRWMESGT